LTLGSAVLGILIPSFFVLQIVDSSRQLSEGTGPDGIFAIFESSDGAFGNLGLAAKKLSGKLFCFRPDFFPPAGEFFTTQCQFTHSV
jgi:hypothetical protein